MANCFITQRSVNNSGSGYGGMIHLSTVDFMGKNIIGSDGTNTVTGQFDSNGNADIIVPSVGPWTFTCENIDSKPVSGLVLEKTVVFNVFNGTIYDNGDLKVQEAGRLVSNGCSLTYGANAITTYFNGSGGIDGIRLYFLVDTTNYSTAKITFEKAGGAYVFAFASASADKFSNTFNSINVYANTIYGGNTNYYSKNYSDQGFATTTWSIDISSLIGNNYIGYTQGIGSSTGNVTVYKIWLE